MTNPALQIGRKRRKSVDSIGQAERQQMIRPMTWAQRAEFLEAAAADRRYAAVFATLTKAGP